MEFKFVPLLLTQEDGNKQIVSILKFLLHVAHYIYVVGKNQVNLLQIQFCWTFSVVVGKEVIADCLWFEYQNFAISLAILCGFSFDSESVIELQGPNLSLHQ